MGVLVDGLIMGEGKEGEEGVEVLYSLYISRCLAAWGDRLWQFVGSLFLLSLVPDSLQLVGVYGLVSCVTVLFCGAPIGSLVDKTSRMKMVTCAVTIQNIAVALTCVLVAVFYSVSSITHTVRMVIAGMAVCLAVLSYLSSIAAKLSVEKDWLVCLCGHDSSLLAKVNANV